ncbi:MAG: hypothetical protein EBR82_58195 [Caulobacteraceae bacterium]|nr:hypothetical protein [Caulobacteraceae bacterium]
MFVSIPIPFLCQAAIPTPGNSFQWHNARAFAFRPVMGQQVGFRVHLENGATYYPVYPSHMLAAGTLMISPKAPLTRVAGASVRHPWNCLSDAATAYTDPYLFQMRGQIKGGGNIAQYLFTICFENGPFVADPEQFKAFDVTWDSFGHLHVCPGYHYLWLDKSFTKSTEWPRLGINTGWQSSDEAPPAVTDTRRE